MPPKYGTLQADSAIQDALLDKMIETDIDFWVESKQREPEQLNFEDEGT